MLTIINSSFEYTSIIKCVRSGEIQTHEHIIALLDDKEIIIPFTYEFEYKNNKIINSYITILYETTLPINEDINTQIITYLTEYYAPLDITTNFIKEYPPDSPEIIFLEASHEYEEHTSHRFVGDTDEYIILKINGIKRIMCFKFYFSCDYSNGIANTEVLDLKYDFPVNSVMNNMIKIQIARNFPFESNSDKPCIKSITSSYDKEQQQLKHKNTEPKKKVTKGKKKE
ncbi:MAG: hypothetical protein Gaeavirus23_6 [Gaeavirus sp.]|uniref:Uncharacterized protein n=1 Tax=Gaeavirus sp. TaxID=2487767 RepID=A0A3G4ZZB5_9VIRU|nr:MAG: hypothetical protein Gaeavirus23_6 [Gaeavirus sp.]